MNVIYCKCSLVFFFFLDVVLLYTFMWFLWILWTYDFSKGETQKKKKIKDLRHSIGRVAC